MPRTAAHHRVRLLACLGLSALALCAGGGCRMMSKNHNSTGVTQYQQGQYQTAVVNFQQAISTDPTNAESYYNLACAYHQMAKQTNNPALYKQAEDLYNVCLDKDANNVECHRALAVLLVETNRQDKAFTLMKNWANGAPQVAAARVELARLYEEHGDAQTAAIYLSQALQINPNDSRALAALGKMREQAGDVQQALVNYQRSYQLNPAQPGVAERLAALQRSAAPAAATTPGMAPIVPTTQPGTRFATPATAAPPRY
ncbi:MAG TPA: tetratricopeptide repeat protein [Pirellulaceae bacterium]|nr:tetratricopeptide repeat protein [Pirellulaceae bacterium]